MHKSMNIFEVSRNIFWNGVSPPESILKSIDSQENNMEHRRSSGAGSRSGFATYISPLQGYWNTTIISAPSSPVEISKR